MFSNGLLVKNVQGHALGCNSPVTGANLVTSRCFPPLGSINYHSRYQLGFPGGTSGKELTCQCWDIKDTGSIPGLGRSLGEGKGNPFWCSDLENHMDKGGWWVTVHWVTKSRTRLKWVSMHPCIFSSTVVFRIMGSTIFSLLICLFFSLKISHLIKKNNMNYISVNFISAIKLFLLLPNMILFFFF